MRVPLQKVTAVEAIVESLKERMRTGEFMPGDRLPSEQEMLTQYNVSRLTLREALARLAALGIIRVHHGKGAFVAEEISPAALDNVLIPLFSRHDAAMMQDLVDARAMIESEIAVRVAKNRTDEDLQLLRELIECDKSVFKDPERFARQDYAFHEALVDMAGNQFLKVMYRPLYHQIRSFLVEYATSADDLEAAMERHRPILEAIQARDAEAAQRLAKGHAAIGLALIKKNLPAEEARNG